MEYRCSGFSSLSFDVSLLTLHYQLVYQVLERRQLPLVDQIELLDEEDEMFEGCVEMSLFFQVTNVSEVLMVHMGVDSEKALEDGFCDGHEILWKRHTYSKEKEMREKEMEGRFENRCAFSAGDTNTLSGRVIVPTST